MSSPHPAQTGNGHHHSAAAFEDDLELTLGLPSFNNVPPPMLMQQPAYSSPTPVNLQPFFFRSLPTNPNPSPFPAQLSSVQLPIANVHDAPSSSTGIVDDAPSSSTGNPPRRHQPRQKQSRPRGNTTKEEKSETIPPPYPWATDKRCGIHPCKTLISNGHKSITGQVKCRKCERSYEMALDLKTKFVEVGSFLGSHKEELKHRAPDIWMNPALPDCAFCHQKNAVRPEIEGKKKNINWLFLFLSQMLGCCTGEQLKYFCKHNCHHRTAAKDRLLYLAYLCMCNQLDPTGPFDLQL